MAQNRYVFAQRDVDDFSCIKIVEGNYKDIIYTYGHVKFASEENEKGEIPLKFDYDVLVNPNQVKVDTIEFQNYIGDILLEVVQYQLDNGTLKFDE